LIPKISEAGKKIFGISDSVGRRGRGLEPGVIPFDDLEESKYRVCESVVARPPESNEGRGGGSERGL
jgi:hypothetical protein